MMQGLVMVPTLTSNEKARLEVTTTYSDKLVGKDLVTVKLWEEVDGGYLVPRWYAREERPAEWAKWDKQARDQKRFPTLDFSVDLRDYQRQPVASTRHHLVTRGSGILKAPCGSGKTCMGLNILASFPTRALILVHSEFLLEQWVLRIRDFLGIDRDEIGIVKGPRTADPDARISIGMAQTFIRKKFKPEFYRSWGMSVYDEVHRYGAPKFQTVLGMVASPLTLGLTATLRRSDGLDRVLRHHIGGILAECDVEMAPVEVRRFQTGTVIKKSTWYRDDRGRIDSTKVYAYLSRLKARNSMIAGIIRAIRSKGSRRILVLSHYRDQLRKLREMVGTRETMYFCGKCPETDRRLKPRELVEKADRARVIFGTYAMAREALDVASLDTLVYAAPCMGTEQSTGRIRRFSPDKLPSVVVDPRDIGEPTDFFSEVRERTYGRLGYQVKDWND